MAEFTTIEEKIETEIVEKKSKFIATIFYVSTVEEAQEKIYEIKKKYHDAKHHCVAYRILQDNQILEKSSDDGEPSGTAGAPMLQILQKQLLVNVVAIVTRYFGGILLGTGGLVRAYSGALTRAIEQSNVIEKCQGIEMLINLAYSDWESFKYYCKNNKISITDVKYNNSIQCMIELEEDTKEKLKNDFEIKKVILDNVQEMGKKLITKM